MLARELIDQSKEWYMMSRKKTKEFAYDKNGFYSVVKKMDYSVTDIKAIG